MQEYDWQTGLDCSCEECDAIERTPYRVGWAQRSAVQCSVCGTWERGWRHVAHAYDGADVYQHHDLCGACRRILG